MAFLKRANGESDLRKHCWSNRESPVDQRDQGSQFHAKGQGQIHIFECFEKHVFHSFVFCARC